MSGSAASRLAGTEHYVPDQVLTNADLEKIVDTSDEWITSRTGIKERRLAGKGESSATLGLHAGRRAIVDAGLTAADIDLLICATVSPEMPIPSTACILQSELGLRDIPAFDLQAACSGFIYAWTVADQMIRGGGYRNALVIAAETMTQWADWTDRSTCILFGDGAGAALLVESDDGDRGLKYQFLAADGNGWELMHVAGGGSRHRPSAEMISDRLNYVRMNGREIYKFAVTKMTWLVEDALTKTGLTVDDVKMVVPHQVNKRIIDSSCSRLGFAPEKVYVNIDRFGNTSAASIPIALDELRQSGRLVEGDVIIMVAFGAGLTWASAVVRL